jgi:DNA-binding PadR family transcriptional regulator
MADMRRRPGPDHTFTDVMILFFIRGQGRSGYDIRKLLAHERVASWVQITPATIYQSLRRLEEDGFVTSKEQQAGNYPAKTIYRITKKGVAFHDNKVEEFLASDRRETPAFRVGLSCAAFLPVKKAVAAMKKRCVELGRQLQWIEDRLKNYSRLGGMQFPEWIHLAREKDLLKAEIAWLDEFSNHYAERK